jgi:hypothetical protein
MYCEAHLGTVEAGSLKMNTALEYSTRVVQEGGRRCKKSTLNDLVHLTPLRIPLMNPPLGSLSMKTEGWRGVCPYTDVMQIFQFLFTV